MCTFLPLPLTNLESGWLIGQECDLPGMTRSNLAVVPQSHQPHKTWLRTAGERNRPLPFPPPPSFCTSFPLPVPIHAPSTWCPNPSLSVCASREWMWRWTSTSNTFHFERFTGKEEKEPKVSTYMRKTLSAQQWPVVDFCFCEELSWRAFKNATQCNDGIERPNWGLEQE